MIPTGLQDIANIAVFVAPGYFAIQVYAILFAKDDRDWSKTILESIALSLPLVGAFNYAWTGLFPQTPVQTTSLRYIAPLIVASVITSYIFAWLRRSPRVRELTRRLNIPDADNDFLRKQFNNLGLAESVTVMLRNQEIFTGTPSVVEPFKRGRSQKIVFNNLAWYIPGSKKKHWDERAGSLIVSADDILYIESESPLKD
jgi:hypothetical protein